MHYKIHQWSTDRLWPPWWSRRPAEILVSQRSQEHIFGCFVGSVWNYCLKLPADKTRQSFAFIQIGSRSQRGQGHSEVKVKINHTKSSHITIQRLRIRHVLKLQHGFFWTSVLRSLYGADSENTNNLSCSFRKLSRAACLGWWGSPESVLDFKNMCSNVLP